MNALLGFKITKFTCMNIIKWFVDFSTSNGINVIVCIVCMYGVIVCITLNYIFC